jgi:hypothetical protein
MRQTQSLDAVWFPPTNFSYCNTDDRFTISEVHRYFDVHNARYKFNFTSISSITVDNLNKQGSSKEKIQKVYWRWGLYGTKAIY